MKKCSKCLSLKAISEFHNQSASKDGHFPWCKDCVRQKNKEYYLNPENKVKAILQSSIWQREHKKEANIKNRRWRANHPEYSNPWSKAHPEYYRSYQREWSKKPSVVISDRIRSSMGHSLRGNKNSQSWQKLTGYTTEELINHLSKRFKPGMSWDNIGKWHIDHIIPIAVFNFETPDDVDFKKCWALKNLRPLWASENMSKGARIKKPFQPSLLIASR